MQACCALMQITSSRVLFGWMEFIHCSSSLSVFIWLSTFSPCISFILNRCVADWRESGCRLAVLFCVCVAELWTVLETSSDSVCSFSSFSLLGSHFIHCRSSFSVFMWLRSFSPWISLCSKSVCRGLQRVWMPCWSPFWWSLGGCGWSWRRVWSGSHVLDRLEVCLQRLWCVEDIFIWLWNDEIGTLNCGLRSLPRDVVGQLSATC